MGAGHLQDNAIGHENSPAIVYNLSIVLGVYLGGMTRKSNEFNGNAMRKE